MGNSPDVVIKLGRVQASHEGGQEFGSQSGQTNDLYLLLPSLALGLNSVGRARTDKISVRIM